MGNPGQFAVPKGEAWLVQKIQDMERQITELRAANPFAAMGVKPMPDGLIVEGYETINGPLEVNGESTINGDQEVNGDSVFNGSMAINGPLILQPGSIENDALTNPLSPQTAHADVANFALATGPNAEMVRATVTVPAGYTQALVMASASMGNRNPTGAVDDMYIDCRINGVVSGWSSQTSVMAGKEGFVINVGTALLTGLSGTFYIAANASSSLAAWPANGAAAINVDAIIMFLR